MTQKDHQDNDDIIRISMDDLPPVITIGEQDLPQIITIGAKDLPEVIRITEADLPEIVQISLQELEADRDLNHVSTDCFHGTSLAAAKKIKREGFRVGPGMAHGAGIYFSVGGVSIAEGYARGAEGCIIRARVNWGKVGYLDNPEVRKDLSGLSGSQVTKKALGLGYNSLILKSKYSRQHPTFGIVLGNLGTYIRRPRIEVIELIPRN